MSLTAFIPARGGSKGIPNKNIKIFDGKPLISWSIEAAKLSKGVDQIIVSTDCQKIADIALMEGAEVPGLRDKNLSTDDSSTVDVVLDFLHKNQKINDILILQPTSPLRTYVDIDNIIALRKKANLESAVSVTVSNKPPEWMYKLSDKDQLIPILDKSNDNNRQKIIPSYLLNGALYLVTKDFLLREKSFISKDTLGYKMSYEKSVDIDTNTDWDLALFYKKRIES
jgi:CMP-N-acetylneuraminic acid synthetase